MCYITWNVYLLIKAINSNIMALRLLHSQVTSVLLLTIQYDFLLKMDSLGNINNQQLNELCSFL